MIVGICLFLLFLLSCIVFPLQPSFFETPKIIGAELSVDILLFLWIILKKNTDINFKKAVPFLLVFILTVVDLIFLQTSVTLFGNPFRLQGILLLWHLLLFALISSTISLPRFTWIIAFVSCLLLSLSLLFFGKNDAGRFVGFLGDPNMFAAAVIFVWPFLFFTKKIYRWVQISSIVFVIISLIVTSSRSGLIAFLLQLLFLGLLYSKKVSIHISFFICIAFMAGSILLPFFDKGRIWESRSEIWQTSFQAGFKSPVIGSGYGNVEDAIGREARTLENNLRYEYVDSSHNILLDWWIQGGVIGVLLFVWLVCQSSREFIQEKNIRECIVLMGILTCLLFNPASIVTLVQFWWLLGQGIKPLSLT